MRSPQYIRNPSSALLKLLSAVVLITILPPAAYPLQRDAALKASLDRDSVLIGDAIVYTVGVEYPRQSTLQPPPPSQQLGPFEVRDVQVLPERIPPDDGQKSYIQWTLVPFSTGDLEIPDIAVVVVDSSGRSDTLHTNGQKVTVASLNPDPQGDIRDIKPPASLPGGRAWAWWLAAVAVAMVGGFLVFRFLRHRRLSQMMAEIAYQGPPRPAHEVALEELERIDALKLLERGLVKEFYTHIAETIKRYAGRRYALEAMEMTTAELLHTMDRAGLPTDHIDLFRSFFGQTDLVKFAKHIPPVERTAVALVEARDIVLITREQPLAQQPSAAATSAATSSADGPHG